MYVCDGLNAKVADYIYRVRYSLRGFDCADRLIARFETTIQCVRDQYELAEIRGRVAWLAFEEYILIAARPALEGSHPEKVAEIDRELIRVAGSLHRGRARAEELGRKLAPSIE